MSINARTVASAAMYARKHFSIPVDTAVLNSLVDAIRLVRKQDTDESLAQLARRAIHEATHENDTHMHGIAEPDEQAYLAAIRKYFDLEHRHALAKRRDAFNAEVDVSGKDDNKKNNNKDVLEVGPDMVLMQAYPEVTIMFTPYWQFLWGDNCYKRLTWKNIRGVATSMSGPATIHRERYQHCHKTALAIMNKERLKRAKRAAQYSFEYA
jgi:hypothetical protein